MKGTASHGRRAALGLVGNREIEQEVRTQAERSYPTSMAERTRIIMSALDDLTNKLDLKQTVSAQTAKTWAKRTHEIEANGKTLEQAAISPRLKYFLSL